MTIIGTQVVMETREEEEENKETHTSMQFVCGPLIFQCYFQWIYIFIYMYIHSSDNNHK